jgi:NTP pyrophosphatase (non-canonical NTP hydrolase)
MEINEYQKKASRTLPILDTQQTNLEHMMYGLASEVGELMTMLKGHYVYKKPFDVVNLIEELGDIAWYLVGTCTIMDIGADDVLSKNIAKLEARYPEKFTEYHAKNRDLANERKILERKEREEAGFELEGDK